MKKSLCALFIFQFISIFSLYAAPNTATAERYMTSANEQYGLENFSKAYTYMNYVLEQYDEKTVTLQVKCLAELIYYDYLDDIGNKKDLAAFKEYQDSVNDFPYIVSDRIQKKLDTLVPVFIKIEEEEQKKKAQVAQTVQQQQTATQRIQQATTTQSTTEIRATIQASNDELSRKLENLEQLIIQLKSIIQDDGYYGIKPEDIELLRKLYSLSETNQNAVKSLLDILYEQEQNSK
ncbi:MAG: hypothetical protein J5647_09995 [Spirochaetaceae bacterium]|nr:hypothetical protein [Spirochaetaceae bacterium]